MDANKAIMAVLAVFVVLAALDRCVGNRLGLAGELERAFDMLGIMGLNVVGLVCMAPVIAGMLQPVVVPQSMHTLQVPFCTMRELPQVGQVLPS